MVFIILFDYWLERGLLTIQRGDRAMASTEGRSPASAMTALGLSMSMVSTATL
jgi:hypothetical protein